MAPGVDADDAGSRCQSPPLSPKGREKADEENILLQVQQFVDEWHYRILHSSLAKKWDRRTSLHVLVNVFELNGAVFNPEEREKLHTMDEDQMMNRLIAAMSDEMRASFDDFAIGIQSSISTAARVRRAIDLNQPEVLQELLDSEATSFVSEQILSQAVCSAGREVCNIRKCHASWRMNSEQRLTRLNEALIGAETARQKLMAVEAQLESFGVSQKGKSKAVLVGMAEGRDKTLKHTVYSSWLGYTMKAKQEKTIRDKFEAEIRNAEDKLIQYQERQLTNVRNVLMRKCGESTECLLHLCVETWQEALEEQKKEGMSADALKAAQAKLAGYSSAQAENTKKVMSRMAAGHDDALVTLIWQGWLQFISEYKKDKDLEDAVKAAEKKVAEFLKSKSEKAQGVLDSMSSGSDTGCLAMILKHWVTYFVEQKKEKEMVDIFNAQQEKFASMNARQTGNARGVQNRINDQINANLLIRLFSAWQIETKVNGLKGFYTKKMTDKKRQLTEISTMTRTMFKSFASELESGAAGGGHAGDDSSGRRSERKSRKSASVGGSHRTPTSKTDALPDIHQRPPQPCY